MSNPITDAINKAVAESTTGSNQPAEAKPVASSTLATTSKSGS